MLRYYDAQFPIVTYLAPTFAWSLLR